jgi:bacterial/archaeal transporter family protein
MKNARMEQSIRVFLLPLTSGREPRYDGTMSWLLLTLLSAITNSISRVLQKVVLGHDQSDPTAFSFAFQMSVALLFLLYTLVTQSFELPNLTGLLPNLVVMALFYSLGNLLIFKAFKYTEAAEVAIIITSSTVWSVLAALVLLGEQLSVLNWLGIGLIMGGVVAVNYTRTNWKLSKGHVLALAGAVLFGLAFTNDAYIVGQYQSVASYMVLAFALPGIVSLGYSPKSVKQLGHFAQPSIITKLLLCSFFYALSAITIFTAYKLGGPASIISPIQQTSIIFTVVLSYFFLNERDKIVNKVAGTLLAFAGVLLLV